MKGQLCGAHSFGHVGAIGAKLECLGCYSIPAVAVRHGNERNPIHHHPAVIRGVICHLVRSSHQ